MDLIKGGKRINSDIKIFQIVMQKNALKSYVQQPWQNKQRTTSFNSIKSEKALKILTIDSENNRPFRRKQEPNINNRKNQYNDIGKLISNTSFGSNPDIRKIISTSPKHYFQSKMDYQQNHDGKKSKPTLRDTKSFSDLTKANQIFNTGSMRLREPPNILQQENEEENKTSILNKELTEHNDDSKYLKNKIQILTTQKKQLSQKCNSLTKKLQELQSLLAEKQSTITQYNIEVMKKIEEYQKQKEINRCLEDIVTQLNFKISDLLSKKDEEKKEREGMLSKEQLEQQAQQLRQKVYNLSRTVHSLQVQTIIMRKIKQELQKQKSTNKCLQKQNKSLKERILTMMKINRVKTPKLSLKQDLDYSVSFEFEQ